MVTAKDNFEWRKTHDARIPFGLNALKPRGVSLPKETFCYGRANRPQTPVKGIILNNYGESAREDMQTRYQTLKEQRRQFSPTNNKFEVRYTNAQLKHDEFIRT